MRFFILMTVLALTSIGLVSAGESSDKLKLKNSKDNFDISGDDISNVAADDSNDLLINYDPLGPRRNGHFTTHNTNKIKSGSYIGLEREASGSPPLITNNDKRPKVSSVRDPLSSDTDDQAPTHADRVKDIALNSREVRLVGPNQKEVEMKDDLPTKFVVAMENLQKEATDVWGQMNEKLDKGWTDLKRSEVWSQMNEKLDKGWTDLKRSEVWGQMNDKLDKGWTDFKSMVEGVVAPSSKQQQPGRKEN